MSTRAAEKRLRSCGSESHRCENSPEPVWDLTDVVSELSQDVDRVLSVESENAAREMLQEYSRHHWPTGKNIELIDTDRAPRIGGRCVGIDSQGRLILKVEQQTHALITGSIVSVTPVTPCPWREVTFEPNDHA